jgi:hypothetical protein
VAADSQIIICACEASSFTCIIKLVVAQKSVNLWQKGLSKELANVGLQALKGNICLSDY